MEASNLAFIREYLSALQRGEVGDELARFFTSDAVQIEFPNRLNTAGQQSDLASILGRSVQGQRMLSSQLTHDFVALRGQHPLSSQRYEIVSELAHQERVAIEARWSGTLAIAVGTLPPGFEMRAHFAMFFECREGRIARQRNYDCFEPW